MDTSNLNILQYSQQDNTDTSETLEDILTASKNNNQLDELQIKNIGTGLFGDSPVSETTGKLNTNVGFDRINQSFKTILRTVNGEVPMLPILGSRVPHMLFETIDEIFDDALEMAITTALTKLEPRAQILTTVISHDEKDSNTVHVEIEYVLTNTNIVYRFRDSIVTNNGGDVL